jgi:hypothetical protein
MTVPPHFRRNSKIPASLVLHKAQLASSEIIRERGYSVTTPMRAIMDLSISGEADRDVIEQALREGKSRGLITRKEIGAARLRAGLPDWLHQLAEVRA